MRIRTLTIVSALTAAFAAAPGFAEQPRSLYPYNFSDGRSGGTNVPSATSGATPSTQPGEDYAAYHWSAEERRISGATALIGNTVRDSTGRPVGTVKGVVYDESGRLSHVLVASGTVAADRLVAIPWSQIESGPTDSRARGASDQVSQFNEFEFHRGVPGTGDQYER
jgi:hypothetical protein